MTASVTTEFEQAWQQWRAEREEGLRAQHGWLSLTALHWLTDEAASYPELPGTWRADGDDVVADGVDGISRLTPVEGAPGIEVRDGARIVEVIRRTGNFALRVHDPAASELADFDGVPTYAPDRRWQIEGQFTAFAQPRTITTGAVVEGLEHHHNAVGTITFEIDGVAERLVAFGGTTGDLKVLFTDATSGKTTYPAARNLAIEAPAAGGRVVLDFNRAANLPCAFSDYATCPVAPKENRLSVAIAAGEQSPRRSGQA
ncbi:DUF1684 domain-containing protein [Antrihabitans cavernicola]|uniref:DUF1684 domain-containing protein n=1 Tax=Antrihabitans cavernicola TaxID=2495913 RepID=A0A5A7S4C9_9NOCA|nr:DUF1684 domain-containing protein [Spelaeibacter cavernicola]KAA0017090.1 DUF1684 domain-containing protein [Spelaeibacter cavernicola]